MRLTLICEARRSPMLDAETPTRKAAGDEPFVCVRVIDARGRSLLSTLSRKSASPAKVLGEVLRQSRRDPRELVVLVGPGREVEVREDVPIGRGVLIALVCDGPTTRELADALEALK